MLPLFKLKLGYEIKYGYADINGSAKDFARNAFTSIGTSENIDSSIISENLNIKIRDINTAGLYWGEMVGLCGEIRQTNHMNLIRIHIQIIQKQKRSNQQVFV